MAVYDNGSVFLFSAVSAGWGWEWFRHPDTLIKKNSRRLKNAY